MDEKFADYILAHHKEDLINILNSPDENQHFSIIVNFVSLFEEHIELGHGILSEPERYLAECDRGAVVAQQRLGGGGGVKGRVHARVTALPACPELHRTVFPRSGDVGSFLRVSGTIVKVAAPRLLEYRREYQCGKCRQPVTVHASFEQHYVLAPPVRCQGDCPGTHFTAVKDPAGQTWYRDYQEVKIQEQVGKLNIGNMPQSMWVTLEDDLVDCCKPGDDAVICGTVLRRWRPPVAGVKSDIELVLKANHVQVCNDHRAASLVTEEAKDGFEAFWASYGGRELEGRNHILASFCPQMYGLYLVKLAVCVVLAGGVGVRADTGSNVRGEPHLLLVGDPGTGKSHLLRAAAKVCPRAVLATGVGSTSAGLTVAAVREGSDWQLEAGALVLSDGGVCCIDEFNSIRDHDRSSIHEAMEQQTLSVAKAGMVTKLNTRCSLLAGANPRGHYDSQDPLTVNIAVPSPLLSRFDLVLVLLDSNNPDWDSFVSSFILRGGRDPGGAGSQQESPAGPSQAATELWGLDRLQAYMSYVKTLNPAMSRAANTVLSKYYQAQRAADSRDAARTTVRMLESLVRLSQGHARLMGRSTVTVLDSVTAVCLMECSMQSAALIGSGNALHTAFPQDPAAEYRKQAELVLRKLGLEETLRQELASLDRQEAAAEQPPGPPGPPAGLARPEDSGLLSQRLTEVLTGIRRNKDRSLYEAMKHKRDSNPKARKRAAKDVESRKRPRALVLSDSEEEDEGDGGEGNGGGTGDEPVGDNPSTSSVAQGAAAKLQQFRVTPQRRDSASRGRDSVSLGGQSASVDGDSASLARDIASLGGDSASRGRDSTSLGRDIASLDGDSASRGRDSTSLGRDIASLDGDSASLDGDSASLGRDIASRGRDIASLDGDSTSLGRDSAFFNRESVKQDRDTASTIVNNASFGRESVSLEKENVKLGRNIASSDGDSASLSREGVKQDRDTASMDRNSINFGRDSSQHSSQSVFTLEEMEWNDVDLEI